MFVFGCCFLHPPEPEGLVRKSNFRSDKLLGFYKSGLVARETALKGETDPICEFITGRKTDAKFWSLIYFETCLGAMHGKNRLHFSAIHIAKSYTL